MYTEFFSLKRKPFELLPDPEFMLLSRAHKKAMLHLNYGISENIGFILITGEVGTGKTTLIRKMIKGLGGDVKLARVNNTRVSSEQLISMINEDFGLEVKGKGKTEMLSDLTNFLINQFSCGGKSMIIIDEAQNLSPDLLEEIRLLSNLETDRAKLVQIILVGQPELQRILARPKLRQLRQRISISSHIQPLTRDEAEEYIFHRLEVAGNRNAISFQNGAVEIIHAFSRGIPRLINIACDFLMLSAFVEGTRTVSIELVKEVIGELESSHGYWQDEELKESRSLNTDVLKEVLNRIGRLEACSYKAEITKAEREEILGRLAEVEALLEGAVSQFKAEMASVSSGNGNDRAGRIPEEMNFLREKVAEFERKLLARNGAREKRKPSLWERLFN